MSERFISWTCGRIWCFSEARNINLGRFGPWIFGGMIGARPHRVREKETE